MSDDIFTDDDFKQSAHYGSLSPAYFASRRMADRFMAAFEAEHFKPLLDEFAKQFSEKLWTGVADSLMSDTESNIQLETSRMVDYTVHAILSGENWAVERYALAKNYEMVKVRAAIAAHIPKELQEARLADLEEENRRLREDMEFYKKYRS